MQGFCNLSVRAVIEQIRPRSLPLANLVYKRGPGAPPMPLDYFKVNILPKCQYARSDYIASQDAFGMDNKAKELDENNNILGLVGHSFDSDFRNAGPTTPTPVAAPAPTQLTPTLAAEMAPAPAIPYMRKVSGIEPRGNSGYRA